MTAIPTGIDCPMKSEEQPQLSKKDRQKLKKLRKRASKVQIEAERSGLLTSLEWLEYQRLETKTQYKQSVGPSVTVRKRKEGIKVEGVHHRDLLAWFLQKAIHPHSNDEQHQQPKKLKKRPRSENEDDPLKNTSIPSWASIHNPGTVKNIAVLEVHISDGIASYSSLLESHLKVSSSKRNHAVLQTKWFQGPMPRSISESLLYFVADKQKKLKKNMEMNPPPSKQKLLENLQNLTIAAEDLARERYPEASQDKYTATRLSKDGLTEISLSTDTITEPVSISPEDAKALVDKTGFRVETQKNEDDKHSYICTQPTTDPNFVNQPARVFGLDCEMVLTSLGSELARLTLVQFEGFQDNILKTKTILDILVKPDNPVQNYLTPHSGITAKLLEPVSTRLAQVQVALVRFLQPNDILVGHSLENDLHAIHYVHPNVIDTALVFRHNNKRTKFSLRHLAFSLLRKTIQNGSHCSEQDAEVALELAVRRAWIGESFGIACGDERKSLLDGLNSEKATVVCIGPASWIKSHVTSHANGVHALNYDSILDCKKAMLAWLTSSSRNAHLIWSNLILSSENKEKDLESFKSLLVSGSVCSFCCC